MLNHRVTISWTVCAALTLYSLWIHTPPRLVERQLREGDAPYALYLVGACVVSIICVLNTLIIPSLANGRLPHIILGRVGLVAGVLGFVFGVAVLWWPGSHLRPYGLPSGIAMGSIGQLCFQYLGYQAIKRYQHLGRVIQELGDVATEEHDELVLERDYALRCHILYMVGLYMVGCAPAAFELSVFLNFPWPVGLLMSVCLLITIVPSFANAYQSITPSADNASDARRNFFLHPEEEEDDDSWHQKQNGDNQQETVPLVF